MRALTAPPENLVEFKVYDFSGTNPVRGFIG